MTQVREVLPGLLQLGQRLLGVAELCRDPHDVALSLGCPLAELGDSLDLRAQLLHLDLHIGARGAQRLLQPVFAIRQLALELVCLGHEPIAAPLQRGDAFSRLTQVIAQRRDLRLRRHRDDL